MEWCVVVSLWEELNSLLTAQAAVGVFVATSFSAE